MILLVLALACRRPTPAQAPLELPSAPSALPAAAPRPAIVGPWSGAGLILTVPEGYRGEAGAVKERLIVRVVHEATRGELRIEAYPPGEVVGAPTGCAPLYAGQRHWRDLPALGPSEVLTCVPDDPNVPIETRWVVREESRTLVLTAVLPPGRAFEARRALEAVLDSVRRTGVSAGGG